jgi:ribosomal-protein-alanine N-acetyltransferase
MNSAHLVIETARFRLRPLTVEDASPRYLSWFVDPTVGVHISSAEAMDGLDDVRSYIRARVGRDDVVFLGIFDKQTCEHIGNIKYEPIDAEHKFAVMGILIGEAAYRGKGVAAEVLHSSAQWMCEHRGLTHIILTVDPGHAQAIRAYEASGFSVGCPAHFTPVGGVLAMVKWLT